MTFQKKYNFFVNLQTITLFSMYKVPCCALSLWKKTSYGRKTLWPSVVWWLLTLYCSHGAWAEKHFVAYKSTLNKYVLK